MRVDAQTHQLTHNPAADRAVDLAEDLAGDLAMALDPVIFGRRVGLELDPWQRDVVRSARPRLLLNCSRQSGKSTTTALLALHTALYRPEVNILLLSPSLRQSSELFRRVTALLDKLEPRPALLEENKLSLQAANRSRIVSLPASESTVRGFTADLIIEDEAARVPDDLYRAIRPMLATRNGRIILMSTPFGKRGHFHAEWTAGGETWGRVLIPATQCPRITPAFLAEERRSMGDLWFRSEYLCEFAETVDSVFRYDDVMAMVDDDVEPLFAKAQPDASGMPGETDAGDVAPLFGDEVGDEEGW